MQIMISGSHGLIGARLVDELTQAGHTVFRLGRRSRSQTAGDVVWDPATGEVVGSWPEDLDVVVHLAGASIAEGRWTQSRMAEIRDSRVVGTRRLCEAMATWQHKPSTLICASAIGFYGDRGEEQLDESSAAGTGFLATVCQEWEAAADAARQAGIRVAHLRLGMVLSPQGGALQKMLLPFKLGMGGIIGHGRQYWSSVFLDDVVAAILHVMERDTLAGPVNVVGPQPVTNRDFTKILGRVIGRPTIMPMPRILGRIVLGKMVDELMIASARVLPQQLLKSGFRFKYEELETGLRETLARS